MARPGDHDTLRWLTSSTPWAKRPPFEVPNQLLSEYSHPADYSKDCMWHEMPHRAAADRFLLAELGIYQDKTISHMSPRPLDAPRGVAAISEPDLLAAVEVTAASWPGWQLSGDESDPIRGRLDKHFAPAHAAYLRWVGFNPVERHGES